MILALAEFRNNEVNALSKQTLTFARDIASQSNEPFEAVVIGECAAETSTEIFKYGPSKLHHIRHEKLATYSPQTWASAITQLCQNLNPQALIAPASVRGNEILSLVAAKLSLPLSTNSTKVKVGEKWEITRSCWAGNLHEHSVFDCSLKLITLAPQTQEETTVENTQNVSVEFSPDISEEDTRVKLIKIEKPAEDEKNLANATIVIGGGRGVGSAEGFGVLQALAELVDGVVGGSRVTTNNGWIPHRQQIGLTGTRISPKLYIACGISGAIQHLSGCKSSKNILVINKDPDASFFNKAKYGVVGDLHEVIPAVVEELKK